jgi:deoxyribose-phosphate aldolase
MQFSFAEIITIASFAPYAYNNSVANNFRGIAKTIDHALLTPSLTTAQIEEGIQTAIRYNVASVCILPYYVRRCAELLKESEVLPSTTIGFPHGANATTTKIAEAIQALEDGAREIDFVVNISQVMSERWEDVHSEIHAVIDVTHNARQKAKIIFENCYLNEAQKIRLCEICGELRADWVKTSTGFGRAGATIEDVKLMRKHSPPEVQIKAAGGIRDLQSVLAFCAAGATRIGTSRTIQILEDYLRQDLKLPF